VLQERIAKEIEHGRFLAKHWAAEIWNWEGPASELHWARRVKMLSNHLRPEMGMLELGCGTGYLTRELARSGADIVAIDVSAVLLEIAQADFPAENVRYGVQNTSALTYANVVFDSVVGSSVLHHWRLTRHCVKFIGF